MKRFFDTELETLRSHLVLLGEKAIDQVRLAMQSLVDGDAKLADEVRRRDDEIDNLEVSIDEEAIRYLSLRSPVASELRLVIVGMKAADDLERVGDEATNIAKRAKTLSEQPPLKPYIDLPRMANLATKMLRDALDCFLEGDEVKALDICRRDKEVDGINHQLYRELSSFMVENPSTTSRALELMFISKSLERIADHATNLAEEVIFLRRGEDIRHTEELKAIKKGAEPGS